VCSVEVTGEGGLDRNLCGLAVSNLADHHHVRVRTQDRAQRRGERQPRAHVDLHLVDPLEPILDRVLDGDDVDLGPADLGERSKERRRLTGTGRPCDEQRAGRPFHDLGERLPHRRRESELLERRRALRLVEQTHDERLALDEGDVLPVANEIAAERRAGLFDCIPFDELDQVGRLVVVELVPSDEAELDGGCRDSLLEVLRVEAEAVARVLDDVVVAGVVVAGSVHRPKRTLGL